MDGNLATLPKLFENQINPCQNYVLTKEVTGTSFSILPHILFADSILLLDSSIV